MAPLKVSLTEAMEKLKSETVNRFTMLMKHGTMSLEYYSPIKVDPQQPHRQDELYIIASGHGKFYRDGTSTDCKPGDVLFVPAGIEHRFEDFSDDFATWVIFYGADGGEAPGK